MEGISQRPSLEHLLDTQLTVVASALLDNTVAKTVRSPTLTSVIFGFL